MPGPPHILIAGIGNIFLGDDAFGVEVARRLATRFLPEGVRVVDFGIRGLDLAFTLLEDDDVVILVDAMPHGEPPGTIYVIEPESSGLDAPEPGELLIDAHDLDPTKVLRLVTALGGRAKRVLLVGCEPSPLARDEEADEEIARGLSAPVRLAVEEAIRTIESLITEMHGCRHAQATGQVKS